MKNQKAARKCAAALLIAIVITLIVWAVMITAKISGIIGLEWAAVLLLPLLIPFAVLLVSAVLYAYVIRPSETDKRSK